MKKVLIVTPRSPFQGRGADEQDRLSGIRWFIENGYEVRVITKTLKSDEPHIEEARRNLGIKISSVSYKFRGRKDIFRRLINPLYWDGAAYEYFDEEIQEVLKNELDEFRPDYVWFDYTYLWPLYKIVRSRGIPILTRSINFEPIHFLDEDGRKIINYLRVLPKYLSEILSLNLSSALLSINKNEEKIYRRLGFTKVINLPLRSLPERVSKVVERNDSERISIGFTSSTYTVVHNLEALLFIVNEVWPLIPTEIRKKVMLRVTGNKLPEEIKNGLPDGVVYEGFVQSSIDFWNSVDIALSPSLFGAGMQQKVFEPMTLGVPTITSKRGLAGYPFICGKDVVCASSKEEIAYCIVKLVEDKDLRVKIGNNSKQVSKGLFSKEMMDSTIKFVVAKLIR